MSFPEAVVRVLGVSCHGVRDRICSTEQGLCTVRYVLLYRTVTVYRKEGTKSPLCTYRDLESILDEQKRRKMFITIGQMRQAETAAAQNLLKEPLFQRENRL